MAHSYTVGVHLNTFNSTAHKKLELPGGGKIGFDTLDSASEKVEVPKGEQEDFVELYERAKSGDTDVSRTKEFIEGLTSDPTLSLVALRIEIEKRLRKIAQKANIDSGPRFSMIGALRNLSYKEVIDERTADGLNEIIQAGNRAAHGQEVDENVRYRVEKEGIEVIAKLDFIEKSLG